MLPVQAPFRFENFGGGITDNDVTGEPNQYKTADNLSITPDLKLLQRPGSQILSSTEYQLPGGIHRVSKLINYDADTELLGAMQTKIYYRNAGTWTSLLGPAGGDPFSLNDYDTQIHEAQWQKHIYLTSESGNKPIKLFKNGSNAWQARTAGLPEFTFATAWSDGGLSRAITLANALRTLMISHYGDAVAAPTSPATVNESHKTHADLAAQAAAVTASVAATNLATLITLINVLRDQYNLHVQDIRNAPRTKPNYHLTLASGPYTLMKEAPLLNFKTSSPTSDVPSTATIAEVIVYLNDLRDKWNYHSYAMNTHYNAWKSPAYPAATSVYTGFGKHKTSLYPLVENSNLQDTAHSGLQIAPNYGTMIGYIQDFKTEYDAHAASYNHLSADTYNAVPAQVNSSPVILSDAVILLAHTAYAFWRHYVDANIDGENLLVNPDTDVLGSGYIERTWFTMTGNLAAGTNVMTVTSLALSSIFGAIGAEPYVYLMPRNVTSGGTVQQQFAAFGANARGAGLHPVAQNAVSSTATTVTFTNNAGINENGSHYIFAKSKYHHYRDTNTSGASKAFIITPEIIQAKIEAVDLSFLTSSSLSALGTAAESLAALLEAHELDRAVKASTITGDRYYDTEQNSSGKIYDRYVLNGDGSNVTTTTVTAAGTEQYMLWSSHDNWLDAYSIPFFKSSTHFPIADFEQERFDDQPVGASYLYEFLYRYDYSVGSVSYQDFSAPSVSVQVIQYVSEESPATPDTAKYPTVFTQIPSAANASGDNYDVTNFYKEIYRTVNGGTVFYKLGEVTNATTTYTDSTLDSDSSGNDILSANQLLYTTGGVVANDAPPVAKYIHILDNIAYYANVTEGGVAAPYRLRQSIPSDPDSAPADFILDFDQTINGISSIKNNIIVGCTNSIFRVTGFFDELGRGALTREVISDTVGVINHESMVKTDSGLFFAANNGFFYTDGYQVSRVTPHLETSYLAYTSSANQKARLVGCYMRFQRKIIWTIQTTSGGTSADIAWELDLDQGIKQMMPFTTWSGVQGFKPTALTYFSGQLIRGTADGYVLKHDASYYTDPKVDTAVVATSWTVTPVLWTFKSCDMDYGSTAIKKYWLTVAPQFVQHTNLSVGISSDIDRGRIVENLTPIRSRKLADWGDANVQPPSDFVAKSGMMIDEFRRFKSGSLRSNYLSVGIKNGYVVVTASSVAGPANLVDLGGGNFSATLTTALKKWPNYVVDYYLRIANVDYLVTERTSDTVIKCTGSPTIAAGVSWELWGYPKNEYAHLISFNVRYSLVGDKTKDYSGPTSSDGGQNA